MGANAQTAVPVFTAGQVLTAQQQTEINTGIPVFATTVTRDAAFGGTGEKTLAEGQFAYIEATNTTQYYDGAAWQSVSGSSGLTLISATTIGTTVSSVTVSGAFSTTYDNYKILISGGVCSGNDIPLNLQFGATTSGYKWALVTAGAGGAFADSNASASSINLGIGFTDYLYFNADVINPFLAKYTLANGFVYDNTNTRFQGKSGILTNTTSYTAFTLAPGSGTITGGTIRVYGYQNS